MKTDHFKPGDKCFIIKTTNPANVGRIVTVVRFCHEGGCVAGHEFSISENNKTYWRKNENKVSYVVYSESGLFGVDGKLYEYVPMVYDRLVKIIDPDEVKEFDTEKELTLP